MSRRIRALTACCLGIAITAAGQTRATTADLSGTIVDQSSAVLPGATVTAQNVGTNQSRSAMTDERGHFLIPALPPGTYDVRAELPGFAQRTLQDVVVTLGSLVDVRLSLNVAVGQEIVLVAGDAPAFRDATYEGYGDSAAPYTYSDVSVFAQDDWRITPRLTAKVGVRYQVQSRPDISYSVTGYPSPYVFPGDGNNIAPRMGLVWDPVGDRKTTIHGAYGLYFDNLITGVAGITKASTAAIVYARWWPRCRRP